MNLGLMWKMLSINSIFIKSKENGNNFRMYGSNFNISDLLL